MVADWRDFVVLHFSVAPEELAPHVPYPLDEWNGRAFVSLLAFTLNRLRPASGVPPAVGRFLMLPVSNHRFLNVRTYVRGPLGGGIHFLAEWVDNPLSLRIGPLTHGLPYRYGHFEDEPVRTGGLRRIAVADDAFGARATFVVPTEPDAGPRGAGSSASETFLFERYRAYTHRAGVGRSFVVSHPSWQVAPFSLARFDTTLLEKVFPWFTRASFAGGHLCDGFSDVRMSGPVRLESAARLRTPSPVLVGSSTARSAVFLRCIAAPNQP